MKHREIAATLNDKDRNAVRHLAVHVEWPENVDEARSMWGDEPIMDVAINGNGVVVAAQSRLRFLLAEGSQYGSKAQADRKRLSDDEIRDRMRTWRPTVERARRSDPAARLDREIARLGISRADAVALLASMDGGDATTDAAADNTRRPAATKRRGANG